MSSPVVAPTPEGPPREVPTAPGSRARLARLVQRQGALVILIVAVLAATFAFDSFGTSGNLTNIGMQASFLAVVALGMTFVIMTGGIDLSVGSVFALGGVLAAWGSQYGTWAALLLPLLVCGAIGLIQGLIIAKGGLPPFIVTLAGLLFARGLLLLISDEGATTYKVPAESAFRELAQGRFLGIGFPIWLVIIAFVIGSVVLHRTSYGATVLAIGGQEDAADLMGLPVARTKIVAYLTSGLLAGFGGMLIASYTSSGVTVLGVGMELEAIAAVVLGGTLLTGGAGTVLGTLVGVLLLQVIMNVINQVGSLNSNWQAVVSGTILLAVVTLQQWLAKVQRR
ncbi:ABC transporter permease [Actinoalloteichus hymeniacidonis]|uniref:Permease component of ribose/xylose/arabinose/galactoside ABC-type transporters n=1 Tax=Actinoalloteichus hymeniacidonis TaxID=340345 RepID=A0AAC9MZ99_9PSEU|nr:ABC transporter permease [Actinoalloteichus hymeniacidonis]AOS63842.1 permease component of ribose/xylose/arabinose/galactoside ABC-type transporters [Actinoalloteichus hymeniacidonis]MBB5908102.1 ribose transport system permease protein [Actinoalloteichus hymeniacidonis]